MLLGFDIGGTKCTVVLGVKNQGTVTLAEKMVLPTRAPVTAMIASLFESADTLLGKNGASIDGITGIGISCGGPLNSKTGMILSPPNLPGWDNIPIISLVEQRFGKTAMLQNDANACAVAEWKYGAGRGCDHMIFLTFGTGMGAGLILNGRLYSGATDFAGEVGHMRMAGMGPVGYGKAGSFEGFCSGGGIAQLAELKALEQLQMGGATTYCKNRDDIPPITAKLVADAAFAGDPVALEVYDICATYLGKGLSVLIDILNPELIVLGGIYSRAKALIEPIMKTVIQSETLRGAREACNIVPSMLGENIGDYAALALAEQSIKEIN